MIFNLVGKFQLTTEQLASARTWLGEELPDTIYRPIEVGLSVELDASTGKLSLLEVRYLGQ